MKISDKQAYLLFAVFYETCRIMGAIAGISSEDRLKIYNEIVNQQSDTLVELNKEEN